MEQFFLPGSQPSEPVRGGADTFGDWLTVAEAVAYCSSHELQRTPKTIRKWAHLSHRNPENADLTVRREDVENGFRWSIERESLDRKIAQELEFEARRDGEPVHTTPEMTEPVHTGAVDENVEEQNTNLSEPVRTHPNPSEPVHTENGVVQELRDRIDDLKGEVAFYQEELRDRRQTTSALTDVIEAFRLTAQSNSHQSRERREREENQGVFHEQGDNSAGAHDVRSV